MTAQFTKAEKKQAKLRLAITGPSGSGKTFSALLIAAGMGKKIAVVDTENHSASLYAGEKGIPDFDILEIEPPYTTQKYIDAIEAAVAGGYDVLVIDSISHAWAGEGGLLAQKEALDGTGRGNSYTNWGAITKEHEKFKSWLLKVDVHLIATMRSKQDYVLETNDKGKQTPRKVGLAPIQREGMEYEFTMVLDVAMNHHASVSKTRVNAFDGRLFIPTKKTGEELLAWLNTGVIAPPVAIPANANSAQGFITRQQGQDIYNLAKAKNIAAADLLKGLGVAKLSELTTDRMDQAKAWIAAQPIPPNQEQVMKAYDAEVEAFVKGGVTIDELGDYVESLPFAKDMAAVAGHLGMLRASGNWAEIKKKMVLAPKAGTPA
jgi:hypothetical protein